MKKRNIIGLSSLSILALALASCGGSSSSNKTVASSESTKTTIDDASIVTTAKAYDKISKKSSGSVSPSSSVALNTFTNKDVDVYLNYKGNSGITYRSETTYMNMIESESGSTYSKGDLLPAWKEIGKNIGVSFKDAAAYGSTKDDDVYNSVSENSFVSAQDASRKIDLFYNTTANINKMGSSNKALNLANYLDKMPNFSAYLNAHKDLREEITYTDGSIYYTPYLDGYQAIERNFVMDTEAVAKLLDNEIVDATLGKVKAGKNADAKGLQANKYTPFIDSTNNYKNEVSIPVVGADGNKITIKPAITENIINKQNALLAEGTDGGTLLKQFQEYLDTVYGAYIGEGKLYSKRSEVFTSASAAYNTDELVALMRVFKACPDVLFGSATKYDEVEALFPRGQDNSRINNILQGLATMFGVQGMGAEAGHLYYTTDGKLNDAETTQASYDMLNKAAQLYEEGLILNDFYTKGTSAGKEYVNRYFAKTSDGLSSYGLMMYDYTATQSAPNDYVNGLGTDISKRKKSPSGYDFANTSVKGVMPVLAPVTYWATETGWDHNATLGSNYDRQFKTLARYYEENRANKGNAWCIPTSSDNIDAALAVMDYMFTTEGSNIQNFGVKNVYWEEGTVLGETSPVLKKTVLDAYSKVGGDIWDFYRQIMGTTQGIGHIRPTSLDFQSTNDYAKIGYNNLVKACKADVQYQSYAVKDTYCWDVTVRTSCYPSIEQSIADEYKSITTFWANDKAKNSADGWVSVVVDNANSKTGFVGNNGTADYKLADVYSAFTTKNKKYLYPFANSVSKRCIPDYAR